MDSHVTRSERRIDAMRRLRVATIVEDKVGMLCVVRDNKEVKRRVSGTVATRERVYRGSAA
jgi:hypothetical protein